MTSSNLISASGTMHSCAAASESMSALQLTHVKEAQELQGAVISGPFWYLSGWMKLAHEGLPQYMRDL